MKIENKKRGYVAALVKPPHKDLGGRLNILLNKHGYEVAIGVENYSKNYLHETTAYELEGLEESSDIIHSGWCPKELFLALAGGVRALWVK